LRPIGKEAVMDPPRQPRGLSLPELLVTLAIAAILATAATPSREIALNTPQ
jgi:prepilin-type N-terminal cleavage/methylation domain-containing protein